MSTAELYGLAPTIYPDGWLRDLLEREEKQLPSKRSRLYRFLVPDNDEIRPVYRECLRELERWISMINPRNRNKITGRLRDKHLFLGAIREVRAVGWFLERGCGAIHEPCLDGTTPDWVLTDGEGGYLAILEFTQSKLPDDTAKAEAAFNDLWLNYVHPIAEKHRAVVHPHALGEPRVLRDDDIRRIANKLEQWLMQDLSPGAELTTHWVQFTLVRRCNEAPGAHGAGGYIGNSSPQNLAGKIKDKVRQYGDIATKRCLPLLVTVFVDPETGQDFRSLLAATTGNGQFDSLPPEVPEPLPPSADDVGPGSLFAQHRVLSAVGWLWLDSEQGAWKVSYLLNPLASYPAVRLCT